MLRNTRKEISNRKSFGVVHKGFSHIFASFQPSPTSPCPRLPAFCVTTPLSVQTLSWKTNKELQNYGKIKTLKKTRIVYLFLVCFSIFQSSALEDDDKITFKCPLLPSRDHTEKDVHLKRNPLSPPGCGYPLWITPLHSKRML